MSKLVDDGMEGSDLSKKVVIYIDYENIHNILRKYFTNTQDKDFLRKVQNYCHQNDLQILDIIVYCNFDIEDLHDSYHQTWLLQHNVEIKHTSNKGKNFADLQIAVDILEQVYKNEYIDGFLIISSDKDMIPLIKAIKRNNKFVHLITTVKDCDYGITIFPDNHFTLEELLEIRDQNGNIITHSTISFKDEIYNNLNNLISKQIANFKHTNFDYYLKTLLPRFRLFKYELLKYLKMLEGESKIYVYKYSVGAGADAYAFITDTYLPQYQAHYPGIVVQTNHITESLIQTYYGYYIR